MRLYHFVFRLFRLLVFSFCCTFIGFSHAGQLSYSTYLGGSEDDDGFDIAVDGSGNAYITGETESTDFPTTSGAIDIPVYNTKDIFVTKLNPSGSGLVYSAIIGGNGDDYASAIALDTSGNAYITGKTHSSDFPITANAFDTIGDSRRGDAFILKLNATGSALIYSTYLGGSNSDWGSDIKVNDSGNAYITGNTDSYDFPITPGAMDTTHVEGFVAKLNKAGSGLIYSTYIRAVSLYLALDKSGNTYITGFTNSTSFPVTLGAYDTIYNGNEDAFVSKLNPTGTALVYSTYLGGNDKDMAFGIAIDDLGNAYITGDTDSGDFPTTAGAINSHLGTTGDGFVTKLNSSGSALVYSTLIGGSNFDAGLDVGVDKFENACITGCTQSDDFPTTANAYKRSFGGSYDAFITKLNSTGSSLIYSTYLGGNQFDYPDAIAVDKTGKIYVTGMNSGGSYPVTGGAYSAYNHGGYDTIITKVAVPDISPYLNSYSEFTSSNDTTHWYFEIYGDGTGSGTLTADMNQGIVAITQSPGQKGKLSQTFAVPSSGWYMAQAKVWSTISDSSKQQKVYLSLNELDSNHEIAASGNQVIQFGNGYFGSAKNPKELSVAFYTKSTQVSVQLVSINPANSEISGSLDIDYIRVSVNYPDPKTAVSITNSGFDDGDTGWLLEPYGDSPTAGIWTTAWSCLILSQVGGQKGKASQLINIPIQNQWIYGTLWVYSDVYTLADTQKVYLYLNDYSPGYSKLMDSGNVVYQPGKWTPGQWQQLRIGYISSNHNNAVQIVGINPDGNSWAGLYFDEVEVNQ
ncbi:MAG: SBBP repeat-containing protein [bacterium]